MPERNQYASCSWDKTIRLWNVPSVAKFDSTEFLSSNRALLPTTATSPRNLTYSQRNPIVTPRALKQPTYLPFESFEQKPRKEKEVAKHETVLEQELRQLHDQTVAEMVYNTLMKMF